MPSTVQHVDFSSLTSNYDWLDEDADVHHLFGVLSRWHSVKAVDLGTGWWSTGEDEQDFYSYIEPDRNGRLHLR